MSVLEEKGGYSFPELEKDNAVYKKHYKLTCVDRQPALTNWAGKAMQILKASDRKERVTLSKNMSARLPRDIPSCKGYWYWKKLATVCNFYWEELTLESESKRHLPTWRRWKFVDIFINISKILAKLEVKLK